MPNDPNRFPAPDDEGEEEELARQLSYAELVDEDDVDGDKPNDFLATNDSSAQHAFVERSDYRDDAFPVGIGFPESIDLWYNKGLYGKVDENYNTIASKNEWIIDSGTDLHEVDIKLVTPVLKKIPSDEEQIFAMNFVVDAFEDFQEYMNTAAVRGDIHPKGSIFVPMKVKRGWTAIDNRYKEQMEAIYQGFVSSFLSRNSIYKKVNNFKKFMRSFSDFLHETARNFPISKSGFVLSKRCPLVATGLAIELADEDHGDDQVKHEQFLRDKNFLFYVSAARRFGFRVDKNAPWRLVADIKSDIMQDYMDRYPELPPEPIPSGSAPTPPCEVLMPISPSFPNGNFLEGLFGDVIGQKVRFVHDPTRHGQLEREGIITGIECLENEPANAKFILETICPGDENDLLDRPPISETGILVLKVAERKILAIREPLTDYMSNRMNVLNGSQPNFEWFLLRLQGANTYPAPEGTREPGPGRRPIWLNTKHAGSMGNPILLDVNDSVVSPGQFFKWTILSQPAPNAGSFFNVAFTGPIRLPDNYRPIFGTPEAIVEVSETYNGIGFLPRAESPGTYRIQVELMDSDGNRIGDPAEVTVEYCIMGWGYFAEGSAQQGIPVDPAKAVAITDATVLSGLFPRRADDPYEHYAAYTAIGERRYTHVGGDKGGELTLGTHPDPDRALIDQMIWLVRRWYGGRGGNITDAAAHMTYEYFNTSGVGLGGQTVHGLFRSSFMSSAVARFLDVVAFDTSLQHQSSGRQVVHPNEKDNANFAVQYWLNHLECFDGVGVIGGIRDGASSDTRPPPLRTGGGSEAGYDSWNYGSDEYGYMASALTSEANDDVDVGGVMELTSLAGLSSENGSGESFDFVPPVSSEVVGAAFETGEGTVGGFDISVVEDDDDVIDDSTLLTFENIIECNEIVLKTKIYAPAPGADPLSVDMDNFILSVGDNSNFYDRRREYERIVLQYNTLLLAYQERVRQWEIWFELQNLHTVVHDDTDPQYGGPLTFDNIFNRQFEKTIDTDISLLQKYIQDFYNSYVLAHPVITKTKIKAGGVGTTRCLSNREMITQEQIEFLYPTSYWATFYYSLRMMESGREISSTRLKNFRIKATNILSIGSHQQQWKRILRLIDKETKGVLQEKLLLTTNPLYDTI